MDFKASTAHDLVNMKKSQAGINFDSDPPVSRLYKDYFSLETGEPLALEAISKRVKRRFAEIDKGSTGAMLDLFFIYQNWSGFYSRTDSFSKYLKDEINISRTHAYGIINSVELLNMYFSQKGNDETDLDSFMSAITSSIEGIGISKLIIISAMKDKNKKLGFVDRLLGGEQITAATLLKKPDKQKKTDKIQVHVSLSGNEVKIKESLVLTFQTDDAGIRTAVIKAVEKWYTKSHKPKKEQ